MNVSRTSCGVSKSSSSEVESESDIFFSRKSFLRFSKRNGVGKMRMAFFKIGLSFFKTFSCADFSVVVVNKTFLGHSKKSSKVSPQINRLNRVLMNLNERGEGIFKVFGVF